jgi:lysophospholipase L1-like esterase
MQKTSRTLMSLGIMLVVGEAAARYITSHWSPMRVEAMTSNSEVKGRYRSHPRLPYVLRPSFEDINSLGFRGPEFPFDEEPGTVRIACVGASTTFGHRISATEAWPAQMEALLRDRGYAVRVINAGVPGWVSKENLQSLVERVLPVRPDIVLVYEGRNEVFPQAYDAFRSDYSHFRTKQSRFLDTNAAHKRLFKLSHLFMLACTYNGAERFGWSSVEENPVYNCIRYENMPGVDGVIENLRDPARTLIYRDNLEEMVRLCHERGVRVALCTMAFRAKSFVTGNLPMDPRVHPSLAKQVERNNDVVRDLARSCGLILAETEILADEPELFMDDCHMHAAGHRRQAEIIAAELIEAGVL